MHHLFRRHALEFLLHGRIFHQLAEFFDHAVDLSVLIPCGQIRQQRGVFTHAAAIVGVCDVLIEERQDLFFEHRGVLSRIRRTVKMHLSLHAFETFFAAAQHAGFEIFQNL